MIVADGPHGLRRNPDVHAHALVSLPATCFPTASCLSSTWNVELIHQVGETLGDECIALDVDVLLGPGTNMKRSPLGGRNFEYFSEDPYLAGEIAAAFINGVQSKGVGTSLKHYTANNQEFQRQSISAEIDERTLREIYLPAFEKAVKQAQPWSIMCAYNKVNGTYASAHGYLLGDILKDEWGFEGFVVSDWGAVRDRVKALQNRLDLEMPGPQDRRVQEIVAAVESGELDEATLDDAARRILRIVMLADQTPVGDGTFDIDAHHNMARQAAAEGMVLLKNDGILPLTGSESIAVIGHSALHPHFQGGGSSHVNATQVDVPLDAIKAYAGNVTYAEGYPSDDTFDHAMIDAAVANAQAADVAVLFIALPFYKEAEGYDRTDLDLTAQQIALIQAVSAAQPKTVVVLNNGSAVVMADWLDGVAAVLEGWMMGQAGGSVIADILYGHINPSGKLSETFPIKLADTPAHINWPGGAGVVRYGEGLFIGYRYYDTKQVAVQFPFGHGLSYTTFVYSNPQVSATTFTDSDGLTVSVDVTNTGSMAGKEVVQIYVHDHAAGLQRPDKELKGFAKVELQPGETKTVSITLDFRAFAYYHPKYAQWITEDGDVDIVIAASATDIRHCVTVTLQSSLDLPSVLDEDSTVREWMADRRGATVLGPYFEALKTSAVETVGGADEDGFGFDGVAMLMDMPLVAAFMWQLDRWPKYPTEMLVDLLAQVRQL